MRTVRIGGVWLQSIGAYSELTTSHVYPRGCEELSFRMDRHVSHPVLSQGGALVEGFEGGERIWRGRLTEPGGDGVYRANGSWAEASGLLALDGSGAPTNTVDDAIDAAIADGSVSWTRPTSISSTSWGTVGEPMNLLDLLDEVAASQGKRWWVDPDGVVRTGFDPTSPSYVIPHAAIGRPLTPASDFYFSHLSGQYISSYIADGPIYATATVGSDAAAARWGRKDRWLTLHRMGVITLLTATNELTNRFALNGARLDYADDLEVGRGEITNLGGTAVPLTMPVACSRTGGMSVRLMGVTDRTRPVEVPYSDIVIGRSIYADGSPTVRLSPLNKAARDLDEVLTRGLVKRR